MFGRRSMSYFWNLHIFPHENRRITPTSSHFITRPRGEKCCSPASLGRSLPAVSQEPTTSSCMSIFEVFLSHRGSLKPIKTIGFNTKSWSSMTWMIWGYPLLWETRLEDHFPYLCLVCICWITTCFPQF